MSETITERYVYKYVTSLERHNKDFFAQMGPSAINLLGAADQISQRMFKATTHLLAKGTLRKGGAQPLLTALLYGMSRQQMIFFTMNSSALQKGSTQLRHKPQYRRNADMAELAKETGKLLGLKSIFISVLSDTDTDFAEPECDALWDTNCKAIEAASNIPTVRFSRMSTMSSSAARAAVGQHPRYGEMQQEIRRFSLDQHTLVNFAATKDFAEKQINAYTESGLMLESTFQHAVLLDIQKKIYPFEQPFYNYMRKRPLAIIYCGQ